jgi:hypothetical protein
MQNNYVKELATKSYQEEPSKEYKSTQKRPFYSPTVFAVLLLSGLFINLF